MDRVTYQTLSDLDGLSPDQSRREVSEIIILIAKATLEELNRFELQLLPYQGRYKGALKAASAQRKLNLPQAQEAFKDELKITIQGIEDYRKLKINLQFTAFIVLIALLAGAAFGRDPTENLYNQTAKNMIVNGTSTTAPSKNFIEWQLTSWSKKYVVQELTIYEKPLIVGIILLLLGFVYFFGIYKCSCCCNGSINNQIDRLETRKVELIRKII